MFNKKNDPQLDDAIERLHNELKIASPISAEYVNILSNLDRLYKIKNDARSGGVKADTIALIAGNLAGIGMIVGHERAHVVTSKALSFVSKLK